MLAAALQRRRAARPDHAPPARRGPSAARRRRGRRRCRAARRRRSPAARSCASGLGPDSARMNARRARSISARSSVGSSPSRLRVLDRLAEDVVGGVERARAAQRPAEVGEQRRPFGRLDREQAAGPLEERRCRAELVAIERAPSRATEERPALERDGTGVVVDATEADAGSGTPARGGSPTISSCPVSCAPARASSHDGEPRVEVGAKLLRHGRVGDVADEHVAEAEAVVALVRASDRAASSSLRARASSVPPSPCRALRQQLRDGASVEQATLDRGALQHGALARLEAVDARRQERVDASRAPPRRRRRDRRRAWPASARRTAGCPRPRRRSDPAAPARRARRAASPSTSSADSSSLSGDSVTRLASRPGRRPRRPRVEEVGAGEAEQQDRRAAREAEHVLEQVEQRRLRPVDVVDGDDERPRWRRAPRTADGRPRPSPRAIPARRSRRSRPAMSRVATSPALDVREELGEAALGVGPGDLADDLGERQVRDARRRRRRSGRRPRAPPFSNERSASRARRDLPIPGGPTIVASGTSTPARRARTRGGARPSSRAAADERRVRRARERRDVRAHAEQRHARERPALALRLDRRRAARRRRRPARGDASPRRPAPRPAPAACSSRAATLTASPVASFWSVVASPTITSPVLTPVRVAMRTPYSRASSSLSRSSASRISHAARTARRASSSCTAGTPNTATTASPMNFSTVPPCRSSVACIVSK